MPIKPENKHRYPKDWPQIRARILQRASNRCEQCDVANHAWGWRDERGAFHWVNKWIMREVGYQKPPFDFCTSDMVDRRVIEIVLTIAHLDHTPENCEADNLRALCQRCHLHYDADHHRQSRLATRRRNSALGDLFEVRA